MLTKIGKLNKDKNMTPEDKELLKIDLLGRIPYNVKCEYKDELYKVIGYVHGRVVLVKPFMSSTISPLIEEVKPYLLPISSIAKRKNVEEFISVSGYETELGDYSGFDSETFYVDKVGREEYEYESENYIEFYPNFKSIDWLNKNNYDYRGLVEKGLAIDASYLNIY